MHAVQGNEIQYFSVSRCDKALPSPSPSCQLIFLCARIFRFPFPKIQCTTSNFYSFIPMPGQRRRRSQQVLWKWHLDSQDDGIRWISVLPKSVEIKGKDKKLKEKDEDFIGVFLDGVSILFACYTYLLSVLGLTFEALELFFPLQIAFFRDLTEKC